MKRAKKWVSLLLAAGMAFSSAVTASAAGITFSTSSEQDDIVILHTNDVHCGIADGLGYAGISAYAREMEAQYGQNRVTLVDAGDSIQGGPIGTLTEGEYPVDIMNQVGYDIFTPGNHEFDYRIPRLLELMEKLDAAVVSSNFVRLSDGQTVFQPYEIMDYGDVQIAYVGITTPEAFTKSTPAYFQDDSGSYLYGFCEDESGQALYENVQASVDAARREGADYVVAVAHLGVVESSAPWRSTDVIANTNGIDVMIDGHSHTVINGQEIANKDGDTVLLNQTGTKLQSIGKIVIDPDTGDISASLITDYTAKDPTTQSYIDSINMEFANILNQVVAKTDVALTTVDPETGTRLIRSQETNLGDLCADAYRWALDADIGLINGGGIRADIPAGDITYGQIISVHPFNNQATSVRVTGQQLLNALEMGARDIPNESGGFLHVSGLTYDIDTAVPSSVVIDTMGNFVRVDGEYRVKNVMVGGEPLDLDKTYVVASHDYMLLNDGDGMVMFSGSEVVKDRVMPDNEVLIRYIRDGLNGVVGEEYAQPLGQGRITIGENILVENDASSSASGGRYIVSAGDSLWRIADQQLGDGSRWEEIYELNQDEISDPSSIYIGQELVLPAA